MNDLLNEIRRSLLELRKGLDGSLNMSEPMEDLARCLALNQVPGRSPLHRCSWERLAWPSRRGLASWFTDALRRVEQLAAWSAAFVTPASVWLPGLFNANAFITAVMQVTARASGQPLSSDLAHSRWLLSAAGGRSPVNSLVAAGSSGGAAGVH